MTRDELRIASEAHIRSTLRRHLRNIEAPVYLFGSRARHNERWNSDYDLWIDADIPDSAIAKLIEDLEDSFVPFKVDIVTTPRLRGRFGEAVRREAIPWM